MVKTSKSKSTETRGLFDEKPFEQKIKNSRSKTPQKNKKSKETDETKQKLNKKKSATTTTKKTKTSNSKKTSKKTDTTQKKATQIKKTKSSTQKQKTKTLNTKPIPATVLKKLKEESTVKTKSLEEYEHSIPEQLELFQTEKKEFSNTIALYDAAPKYLWRGKNIKDLANLEFLKREFSFRDHYGNRKLYKMEVQPALVEGQENKCKAIFPGQREEIIEEVLRKFVADGKGRFLDDKAAVTFTLYEIMKELKIRKRIHSLSEIKEALQVLNRANLTIKDEKGTEIIGSPFFPVVHLLTKDNWNKLGKNSAAYVIFNPLVTSCIKKKTFRYINYTKMISLKTPLERWFLKRLSHNFVQADQNNHYTINLTTVMRDAGLNEKRVIKEHLRDVQKALKALVKKEILDEYTIDKILEGPRKKIIDAKLNLHPHQSLIEQNIVSNSRTKKMRETENSKYNKQKYKEMLKFLEDKSNSKT